MSLISCSCCSAQGGESLPGSICLPWCSPSNVSAEKKKGRYSSLSSNMELEIWFTFRQLQSADILTHGCICNLLSVYSGRFISLQIFSQEDCWTALEKAAKHSSRCWECFHMKLEMLKIIILVLHRCSVTVQGHVPHNGPQNRNPTQWNNVQWKRLVWMWIQKIFPLSFYKEIIFKC